MVSDFCEDAVLNVSNNSEIIVQNQKMNKQLSDMEKGGWPERPKVFPGLMTPVEAAMFLRLDQTGHNPKSACRTLNYWRDRGELNATKFARRVWYGCPSRL